MAEDRALEQLLKLAAAARPVELDPELRKALAAQTPVIVSTPSVIERPDMVRAYEFFASYEEATDEAYRLVAELLADLTLPELARMLPCFRPAPKKRGRPKGSGQRDAQTAAVIHELELQLGRAPTRRETARALQDRHAPNTELDSLIRGVKRSKPGRDKNSR